MSKMLNPAQVKWLTDFLLQTTGMQMSSDREYLFDSRLTPLCTAHGVNSIGDLIDKAQRDPLSGLKSRIVDAMTTHETHFFRDIRPFETLQRVVIPEIIGRPARGRRLRIWSAAASSGQEAYSIAMTLDRMPELAGWQIEIIGTDISEEMIARAKSAKYTQFEVQRGLQARELVKHFDKVQDSWRAKPALQNSVRFAVGNILNPQPSLGIFDICFARNILIYFTPQSKRRALTELARRVNSGGYLFLGGSESIAGMTTDFTPLPGHSGIYRRV